MSVELLCVIVYFIGVAAIGVWASRQGAGDSAEHYLLANRSIGPMVSAFRLQTSTMSGYMFLGAGSLGNTHGFYSMWYALGDMAGGLINLSVLGRRMRKLSKILGAITSIGYLEHRFPSKWVRLIAAPIALSCMFFYVLSQFIAGGKGLEIVTGTPFPIALLIAIAVIVLYTFLGGYLAVAYTDFVQAIIMLVGVMWIMIATLSYLGGLTSGLSEVADINPNLLTMFGENLQFEGQWGMILGALMIYSIGYMGYPHVVVSHMAMRKPSLARSASVWSMIFNFLFIPYPYLLGLLALVVVPNLDDPEMAIFTMAVKILPSFAAGIVMAALMAAMMSTADALLLQCGTIASEDLYGRFVNRSLSERGMVWISRFMVLLVAVLAYIVAVSNPPGVAFIVIFATTVLGSAFAPSYVAAVWWKKANTVGAISSMIVGTVTSVGWELAGLADKSGLDPMVTGIAASTLAMVIGSLATQKTCPVPQYVRAALEETDKIGPIPARMLAGQNHNLSSQAVGNAQ